MEYLKHVHKFSGYGELVFPHCPCDSRKNGHVIVVLNSQCFSLKACSREGEPESQSVEFSYDDIESIDVDNEEMAFIIHVKMPNKPNKKIKIYSGFVSSFLFNILKSKSRFYNSIKIQVYVHV